MSKEFGAELVYGDNDKYIKTEIKICGDNVNRNFHIEKYQKKILHVKSIILKHSWKNANMK